jgi:hypothetical protein
MLSHLNMQASAVTPGMREAMNFQSSLVCVGEGVRCPSRGRPGRAGRCTSRPPRPGSSGLPRPSCVSVASSSASCVEEWVLLNADLYLPQQRLHPHSALQALLRLPPALAVGQHVFPHGGLGQFSYFHHEGLQPFLGAIQLRQFLGVVNRRRRVTTALGIALTPVGQSQELP